MAQKWSILEQKWQACQPSSEGGIVVSCLFQRFTTKYARGHMSEIEEGRGGIVVRSLFLNSENGHLTKILL